MDLMVLETCLGLQALQDVMDSSNVNPGWMSTLGTLVDENCSGSPKQLKATEMVPSPYKKNLGRLNPGLALHGDRLLDYQTTRHMLVFSPISSLEHQNSQLVFKPNQIV